MLQGFCQTAVQLVVSVYVQVANNNIILFYYLTHMLKMKYQMRGDCGGGKQNKKRRKENNINIV